MLWFVPFLLLQSLGCAQENNNNSAAGTAAITGQPVISSPESKIPPDELGAYVNKVKGYIDSVFGHGSLNGSVLVAKHGQIIYEKYMGYANPRIKQDSITSSTPIHLASVSKTFTGMAVLKLWQDGKLNIEDPVNKYLAGFPYPAITVKNLLSHRSGLPKYDHYMGEMGWNRRKMVSNQDVLDFIISHAKTIRGIARPDHSFSYSNTNFALLALIIERVSGLSYHDFLHQTFFTPLGMKDTYVFTAADTATYLHSYYANGRPYKFDFLDMVYGDKNIYSTAEDLLKWDQALRSDSLFTPATLDAAYKGYSFEKPGTKNYGLAWRMYLLKNGKKLIYHNGWWHGNRTAFYRLPEEDVVIIALSNNDCKKVYNVKTMADIFGDYMQGGTFDDEENEGVVSAPPSPKKVVKKSVARRPVKKSSTASRKKKTTRTTSSAKK